MIFFRSIQSRITLSVLLFGLLMILFNNWRNKDWLTERQIERMTQEAADTGSRLAGLLQHLSRKQQERAAELEMSYVSLSPDVDLGLVCNKEGQVTCATHMQWYHMNVQQTPLAEEWRQHSSVLTSMEPAVEWDSEQKNLFVMVPFFETYETTSRAAVLIRYNSTLALERVSEEAWHESVRQAAVLLGSCMLLWFVLDELVTRRVRKVVDILRDASSGKGPPEVLKGKDELSLISREFAGTMEKLRIAENMVLEAAEQERRKIGKDVHDDLCQRLSATKMKAEVMRGMIKDSEGKIASLAGQVADELSESTVIARSMAWGLAPVSIEKHGLKDALENIIRFAEKSYNVRCSLDYTDVSSSLTNSSKELLFRIAQELVVNACKHSSPQVVSITVRTEDDHIVLSIIHDGSAFSEPAEGGNGMGLHLLSQRLRTLSATLERTSETGTKDFQIAIVRIPLNNP
ncbi:sensor histidine kinase [Prosthecobacter vanneervenii]|uniref:histidine kinase n=1 Tax=Prosthecobacter vanneervenii TaxID=48466 RepID=A0A7W7YBD4_9BACT|nr:histidine kinase [Prosthecobacter vanneervenii]MBB5033058.1 signal transduction histidine kinase [Prosthecobacter vanneervenii]